MPLYDFRNKETGDIVEMSMSYGSKQQYLLDNPHIEYIILTAPSLGDPTKLTATRKMDTGFKDVLQQIHARTPGSQLDKTSSQLQEFTMAINKKTGKIVIPKTQSQKQKANSTRKHNKISGKK